MQKGPRRLAGPFRQERTKSLDVERGTAPAGALDRRVVKLEPSRLQRFNVIDHAAVEIHEGSGINKDFQVVKLENLVHHARLILERHGVLKSGAAATHHANA